jgi:Phosphotransferase enzyme family
MSSKASSSKHSSGSDNGSDPRVEVTARIVNWDVLSALACKLHQVHFAHWGEQFSGGYNLVRFLHLDNDHKDIVVVRVPLQPVDGLTVSRSEALCSRIASEVATMQYIESHTSIPVPHVIHHSSEADGGGARSPYILMSKAEGAPLSSLWDEMADDKRDAVLRQVVGIYLELSSHRFNNIGALFKGDGVGKDAWYLRPVSFVTDPDEHSPGLAISSSMYSSGTDYWIAYANANLKSISDGDFGSDAKGYRYAHAWFLRSLIPSLYDNSLDVTGFPLIPGDLHSQNIMITDTDSEPQITSVIDWEFSSTAATSSFAQYPLFIVDHPQWDEDHPLRPRNVRDQAVFNEIMHRAERKRHPEGDLVLSRAFANSYGVYLFQQSIQSPVFFSTLYPLLFAHVFGDDEDMSTDYYWGLMEHGVLKKHTKRFEEETEVWNEVSTLLGTEIAETSFTRVDFKDFVLKNKDRFDEGGRVRQWLAAEE